MFFKYFVRKGLRGGYRLQASRNTVIAATILSVVFIGGPMIFSGHGSTSTPTVSSVSAAASPLCSLNRYQEPCL